MLVRAIWRDEVIAESDATVVVEGNHYFPSGSIRSEFFKGTDTHTECSWKGTASYYTLVKDGETSEDAAWHYAEPMAGAEMVKDRVAF